jgi:yeast amino acid transporter
VKWFFLNYTFLAAFPLAFIAWKVAFKTKLKTIGTADLGLGGEVKSIDDYEDLLSYNAPSGVAGLVERVFGGVRAKGSK